MKCWNRDCQNDTLSPRAVFCPECRTDKPPKPGATLTRAQREERDRLHREALARYSANGPTSADLTPQQWANVCRFFPTVAARCKRPLVTPDDPLWASASMGPLFTRVRVPVPVPERQPGEDDE